MASFWSPGAPNNARTWRRNAATSRRSMPWPTTWNTPHSRQAMSMARCTCTRSASAMSITGGCLIITMASRALARLQPLGQQRIRIELGLAVVGHAGLVQAFLDRAITPRVEQVGAAADVLAADVDLRHGLLAGPIGEHRADLAAEIVLLELHRVDIDTAIGDAEPGEQLAHRPAELAPLEREHHHRLVLDGLGDEAGRDRIHGDPRLRRGGRGRLR